MLAAERMGYRKLGSNSDGELWAKPVGNSLFVLDVRRMKWTNYFREPSGATGILRAVDIDRINERTIAETERAYGALKGDHCAVYAFSDAPGIEELYGL